MRIRVDKDGSELIGPFRANIEVTFEVLAKFWKGQPDEPEKTLDWLRSAWGDDDGVQFLETFADLPDDVRLTIEDAETPSLPQRCHNLLKNLEWAGMDPYMGAKCCPKCGQYPGHKHQKDCELRKTLDALEHLASLNP